MYHATTCLKLDVMVVETKGDLLQDVMGHVWQRQHAQPNHLSDLATASPGRSSPARQEAESAYPVYGGMLRPPRKQLKGSLLAWVLRGWRLHARPAYSVSDVPAVDLGTEMAAMGGWFRVVLIARALRASLLWRCGSAQRGLPTASAWRAVGSAGLPARRVGGPAWPCELGDRVPHPEQAEDRQRHREPPGALVFAPAGRLTDAQMQQAREQSAQQTGGSRGADRSGAGPAAGQGHMRTMETSSLTDKIAAESTIRWEEKVASRIDGEVVALEKLEMDGALRRRRSPLRSTWKVGGRSTSSVVGTTACRETPS